MSLVLIRDPKNIKRLAEFDPKTKSLRVTVSPHSEIHEGGAYVTDVATTTLANGSTVSLAFKTPNTTTEIHMVAAFASKAEGHISILENATWTGSTGSQNIIYNRDRNNSKISIVQENTDSAFTATSNAVVNPAALTGTIIHSFYTWSTKQADTGKERDSNEFDLKINTVYAFRLTADAASNAGQIILNWYEHTPE